MVSTIADPPAHEPLDFGANFPGDLGTAPTDAELRLFRGRYRMDAHDCAGALADFRAAEQERPRDALTFASEAAAEMCLGHDTAARASIERSLQLDPNQPVLRKMLGH